MFLLDKWYLDLVTEAGTVLLLYSGRLRWAALRVNYASVLRSTPDAPADEAATIRRTAAPNLVDDHLTWTSRHLDLEAEWRGEVPPIERTLVTGPGGSIDWNCQMPRARGTIRWGGSSYTGLGYVEKLRVSIPPGRLPFRTLRWGRHLSTLHTLVWIEWDGAAPQRWIWLDGIAQPDARLTSTGMIGLEGGRELRLEPGRDLCDRPVVGSLSRVLPAVARRLVGPEGAMREHKRLSRSSLLVNGQPTDLGWTVHEEVTW